jgi:heptosyltransferase-3
MKKNMRSVSALVIPSRGIGDALLMMIVSEALRQKGMHVTTVHPALTELSSWFPEHHFLKVVPPVFSEETLLVIQNDNSEKIRAFKARKNTSIFYPTYFPEKHGPLSVLDQCFEDGKSFAENAGLAIAKLLKNPRPSKSNGIQPASGLRFRHFQKRVLLHPTSSSFEKNWPQENYLRVAKQLVREGFEPVFIMTQQEKSVWKDDTFFIPTFSDLSALATYTYESGYVIGNDSVMGHLASNLGLPTLIVADDAKRMALWRPDWAPSQILTPHPLIPNFKGLRLRKNYWKRWISPRQVLSVFHQLAGIR